MTLPRRRAPVKPMCGTRLPPVVASATQDNPRPGCREPGLSPSKGGKREVPGSARTRVRERRTRSASKPGAYIVSQIGRESTPSVVQGLSTVREGGDSPGGGRVTRRSGRLFIVGRVTARGGWARRSGPRAPADQRPPGWCYRCPFATWSPPRTTSTGVRHGEPRQPRRPRVTPNRPPSSSVETAALRRNQHAPAGGTTRGRALLGRQAEVAAPRLG
jgi:hypothetical protein